MLSIPAKLLPHAKGLIVPNYATSGSLGLDLRAAIDEIVVIAPYSTKEIPTGICVNLKDTGLGMLLMPRSGLGKQGIVLANTVGLVDLDYHREIKLQVHNSKERYFEVIPNLKIAQAIFLYIEKVKLSFQDNWEEGTRGSFGSTGQQ
jgi:dUTP pyrophosphatase